MEIHEPKKQYVQYLCRFNMYYPIYALTAYCQIFCVTYLRCVRSTLATAVGRFRHLQCLTETHERTLFVFMFHAQRPSLNTRTQHYFFHC